MVWGKRFRACGNPLKAWIPYATLHSWMMSLFYPAVLGTALMGWLSVPAEGVVRTEAHWAPVLIAYFALQYGEGLHRGSTYDRRHLAADVLEILAILAAFDAMGILAVGLMDLVPGYALALVRGLLTAFDSLALLVVGINRFVPEQGLGVILVFIFLIPVVNRLSRFVRPDREPPGSEGAARPWLLSGLSIGAAILAGAWTEHWWAALLVAVLLAVYLVLCLPPQSQRVSDCWNSLRRAAPPSP